MPRRKKAEQALRLPERFTVEVVADVLADLRARLSSATGEIRLDVSSVSIVDSAALQLLAALSRSAAADGRKVGFDAVPDAVADNARLLGLGRFLGLQ